MLEFGLQSIRCVAEWLIHPLETIVNPAQSCRILEANAFLTEMEVAT